VIKRPPIAFAYIEIVIAIILKKIVAIRRDKDK
jgi:hypothetical protein